jgi:hypothetical protein
VIIEPLLRWPIRLSRIFEMSQSMNSTFIIRVTRPMSAGAQNRLTTLIPEKQRKK